MCAECDALCLTAAEHAEQEAMRRRRTRPLREELGEILRYPLRDRVGYVVLSVFVAFFAFAGSIALAGGGIAYLFSQGLVLAYAFTAINRVSAGKMKDFMPDISDLTELAAPLRHAFAALLVSSGPLLLLMLAVPMRGLSRADGAQLSGPIALAFLLALVWQIVYAPVALIAAAISHSFLQTLNPAIGLGAIRSMGSVYWEAMAIYTVISLLQTVVGAGIGLIPWVGFVPRAFVDCYAYLAIGCLLGLAVYKKAPELGMD